MSDVVKTKILLMSASTVDKAERVKSALSRFNLGEIIIASDRKTAREILKKIDEETNGHYMVIGDEITSTWLPDEKVHRIFWDEECEKIIAILREG